MSYVSFPIQQMHMPETGNEVSDLPQPKPYFQRSKTPLSSNLLNQHLFSRSRSESVKGETIRLREQMTKAHSLPNFYSSRALHNRCIGQVLVASEGPLTTSDMRLSAISHVEEFGRLLGDIWFAYYSLDSAIHWTNLLIDLGLCTMISQQRSRCNEEEFQAN